MQPMFEKFNPDIVGVAESEDAAKELLIKMTYSSIDEGFYDSKIRISHV